MALLVGFVVAYPMNWWLVSHHLKHGMMTVRPREDAPGSVHAAHASSHHADEASTAHGSSPKVSAGYLAAMTALSFALLAAGLATAAVLGALV